MVTLLEAVASIEAGTEIHAVTDGDVSAHELIRAIAAAVGRGCDLVVATSAANEGPAAELVALAESGAVSSLRVIACYAVLHMNGPRGKAVDRVLAGRLGMARTHAKFAVATLGDRKVSLLTTANLNVNHRSEAHVITTDPAVAGHLLGVVAEFERLGSKPGKGGAYYTRTFAAALPGVERGGTLRDAVERWSV